MLFSGLGLAFIAVPRFSSFVRLLEVNVAFTPVGTFKEIVNKL